LKTTTVTVLFHPAHAGLYVVTPRWGYENWSLITYYQLIMILRPNN